MYDFEKKRNDPLMTKFFHDINLAERRITFAGPERKKGKRCPDVDGTNLIELASKYLQSEARDRPDP